jgi:adenine-specific DNA-methyltransferase
MGLKHILFIDFGKIPRRNKMNKLKMHSINRVDENVEKIAQLFPNCITEALVDNKLTKVVDFDMLKQELSSFVVEGREERYQFTWPDKKKSILLANSPIVKTLRPYKEESVDFDNTENLYIEGDNLDVLKLLQETYLGKIKMIYIDPPYNTGNDFVYEDDFAQSSDEYLENSGQFDDEGNRLVQNTESNGRFHTDWLNMMYPRLKLAKDLLTNDGVIFISIDENEVKNMRTICDEIYGESNFISQLGWQKVYSPKNQARYFSNDYEFILCYSKNIGCFELGMLPRTEKMNARYKNIDNDPRGRWKPGDCVGSGVRKNGYYDVVSPLTGKTSNVPIGKHWVYAPETMKKLIADNRIYFGKDGNAFPAVKQFLSEVGGRKASSLLLYDDYGHTDMAKKDLIKLFQELEKVPFETPKPIKLIKMLSILGSNDDDIIMDFFAGSATTAHSIFELNASYEKSNRKFILIQLPEPLTENEQANNIGLLTISDVSKERIKRAGKKIKEDIEKENIQVKLGDGPKKIPDIGFRVLKLDSSNMKDVYYNPADYNPTLFDEVTDNIKDDRSPMDLLFQVMLQMDVLLSNKIEEIEIGGKKVFSVMDNYLIACFDTGITTEVVKAIAKKQPYYAVFKDSCMADDSTMASFEQIFETYSKDTIRKVL